jgi:hypothetical protein
MLGISLAIISPPERNHRAKATSSLAPGWHPEELRIEFLTVITRPVNAYVFPDAQ